MRHRVGALGARAAQLEKLWLVHLIGRVGNWRMPLADDMKES